MLTIGTILGDARAQSTSRLNLSLEDDSVVGVADAEDEYSFYARVEDPERVKKLGQVTTQEQWTVKIPKTEDNRAGGSIRVRRVVDLNQPERFVRTTKVDGERSADGLKKSTELNMDSSKEEFEMFKALADGGMHKDRVTIPCGIEGLSWEVDLFIMAGGQYAPWCKIDLEVKGPLAHMPALPPVFDEVIRETGDRMDAQTRETVTQIYERYFITRNHQVIPFDEPL